MPRLDPVALARLGSLPLKARVIVEGALSGLHRARLHGSSVEFAEHKEYSPGDELRHVDWRAFAKLDRYYVKQYEQESQLTVYLVLDGSGSMRFAGSGLSKVEYAGLCLAALAYLVVQQQDKVGLYVFGAPGGDVVVPPRARTSHLHDLLGVIDRATTGETGDDDSPAAALDRIGELARRKRALVVLASDLFDPDDRTLAALRRLRAQKHDVAVLHVLAPEERTFPFEGLTLFQALESDHRLLANPAAIRKDYLERMDAFLARVVEEMTSAGVDYHLCLTDRAVEDALLELLATRQRTSAAGARR
ncbi:MAG: DUF58 domain-containing protein [Kofleriaceae bacterium]|nr:MAG: DUF58 domain-containing protein [Kofleriaceae bacterium]MBZ0235591.1 DUF58 domain-containing protein [Kofleriaceae bacterium]